MKYAPLPSEAQLMAALKQGDMQAFSDLYESYHRRLYGFAMKLSKDEHLAEELVQAVFVAVWENHTHIDVTQAFGAYLFSIARNRFTDMLRRRIVERNYANAVLANDNEEPTYDMEQKIEDDEFAEILDRLLSRLPERRREIFELHRQENFSYKEIAEKLNITENTVDTQIRNVLNYLRKELPKYIELAWLAYLSTNF